MKRTYEAPILHIDRFNFEDILTTSMGTGDGIVDTLVDDEPTEEP